MRPHRTPKRLRRHLLSRAVNEHMRWKMRQPEFKAAMVTRIMEDLMPNPSRWYGKGIYDMYEFAAAAEEREYGTPGATPADYGSVRERRGRDVRRPATVFCARTSPLDRAPSPFRRHWLQTARSLPSADALEARPLFSLTIRHPWVASANDPDQRPNHPRCDLPADRSRDAGPHPSAAALSAINGNGASDADGRELPCAAPYLTEWGLRRVQAGNHFGLGVEFVRRLDSRE